MIKCMKSVLGILLSVAVCLCIIGGRVKACEQYEGYDGGELLDGPSVVFDLNEDNGYTDSIQLKDSSGITTVTCKLSGGVGGIPTLYKVLIFWNGTNSVQAIRATKLYINNGNILKPRTYYSHGFSIEGLGSNVGCREVGTCNISDGTKQVMVGTKGLQAFFYNRDYWVSTGDLYGPIHL